MGTVTLEQGGGEELALPLRIQVALGELVDSAKQGLLAPFGRCRARRARRAARGRGCRDRRAEGQAHPGAHRGRAWARAGRGDARRPSGRGRPAAGAPCRRPLRGAASEVRVRRRPGSAVARGAGADAGWRLHRRYRRTQEPVGQEVEQQARSTSRSSVSRTFIERIRRSLGELMSRRLDDVRLAVMMIDGIDLGERTKVVALGITTEGVKIPLGLWEGSTENASVATSQPRRPLSSSVP
jgi:putative transposase